jgi:GT2 family glycosyltransferase
MHAIDVAERRSSASVGVTPSVLVAILNWNRPIETIACIESVLRLRYPRFTTLLIDNGSDPEGFEPILKWLIRGGIVTHFSNPESPELHPDNSSGLEVIRTGSNLGYAAGNNQAFRAAISGDFDWTLILNNDTTVSPDLLAEMMKTVGSIGRTGMVGCRIAPSGGSKAKTYEGGTLLYGLGVYALLRWHGRHGTHRVNFIPGCAALVSSEMISQIGGFDERYFLYAEDVDLSYRAQRAGWRLAVNLDTFVQHDAASSLGAKSAGYYYYVTRNTLFFIRNQLHGPVAFISRALFLAQTLVRLVLYLARRDRMHVEAVISAIRDYSNGSIGPAPKRLMSRAPKQLRK